MSTRTKLSFTSTEAPESSQHGVYYRGRVSLASEVQDAQLHKTVQRSLNPRETTTSKESRFPIFQAMCASFTEYTVDYPGALLMVCKPVFNKNCLEYSLTQPTYEGYGDGLHNKLLRLMYVVWRASMLRYSNIVATADGVGDLVEPFPKDLWRQVHDFDDVFSLLDEYQNEIATLMPEFEKLTVRTTVFSPLSTSAADIRSWQERIPGLIEDWNRAVPIKAVEQNFVAGMMAFVEEALPDDLAKVHRTVRSLDVAKKDALDELSFQRLLCYVLYHAQRQQPDVLPVDIPPPDSVATRKDRVHKCLAALGAHTDVTKKFVNQKGIAYKPISPLLKSLKDIMTVLIPAADEQEKTFPSVYRDSPSKGRARRNFGDLSSVKPAPKSKSKELSPLRPEFLTKFGRSPKAYSFPYSYIQPQLYALTKSVERLDDGTWRVNSKKLNLIKRAMPDFVAMLADAKKYKGDDRIHLKINSADSFKYADGHFDPILGLSKDYSG